MPPLRLAFASQTLAVSEVRPGGPEAAASAASAAAVVHRLAALCTCALCTAQVIDMSMDEFETVYQTVLATIESRAS